VAACPCSTRAKKTPSAARSILGIPAFPELVEEVVALVEEVVALVEEVVALADVVGAPFPPHAARVTAATTPNATMASQAEFVALRFSIVADLSM